MRSVDHSWHDHLPQEAGGTHIKQPAVLLQCKAYQHVLQELDICVSRLGRFTELPPSVIRATKNICGAEWLTSSRTSLNMSCLWGEEHSVLKFSFSSFSDIPRRELLAVLQTVDVVATGFRQPIFFALHEVPEVAAIAFLPLQNHAAMYVPLDLIRPRKLSISQRSLQLDAVG